LLLQGSECLHELADILQQQLEQLAQQPQDTSAAASQQASNSLQQQSSKQAAGPEGGSSSSGRDAPVEHLLLRLDHMRAKASYSRTIKQWAAELNLTGKSYLMEVTGILQSGWVLGVCNSHNAVSTCLQGRDKASL
jgi:hypothetical protein